MSRHEILEEDGKIRMKINPNPEPEPEPEPVDFLGTTAIEARQMPKLREIKNQLSKLHADFKSFEKGREKLINQQEDTIQNLKRLEKRIENLENEELKLTSEISTRKNEIINKIKLLNELKAA